jgi:hypothetical protein
VLLPRDRDAEAFLGVDEVVVIVGADLELHPVDLSGEASAVGGAVEVGGVGLAGYLEVARIDI